MTEILSNRFFITIALIICAFFIKLFVSRRLRSYTAKTGKDKRYLINSSKNLINLLLATSVFILWIPEIQRFALSIAAFIVAIVLATKEIIQCFIGFIYLSSTVPYRVGDWIQVGEITGEVSETDWAKVTLLEVDLCSYSYTGRSVFIPNNQLMTQVIKNLNYMRRYVNHNFTVTTDIKTFNPFAIKTSLLAKAHSYCESFQDVAERYNALIEKRLDIRISGPAPSLKITTTDLGKTKISFSIFCPTEQAKEIEQKLTEDLFSYLTEVDHSSHQQGES